MTEFAAALGSAVGAMSLWEAAAVLLAVLYLVLAIRQHVACWAMAIASAALYSVLMFQAGLYMEALLQLFYIAMAVYGWISWTGGGASGEALTVTSWPPVFHVPPLLLIALLSAASGALLQAYSNAAFPFIDSATTWGAILATWMVARKVLQNWHYWFLIDAVSVYLYSSRGLYLTALLFVVYLFLIVVGYRSWRRSLECSHVEPA